MRLRKSAFRVSCGYIPALLFASNGHAGNLAVAVCASTSLVSRLSQLAVLCGFFLANKCALMVPAELELLAVQAHRARAIAALLGAQESPGTPRYLNKLIRHADRDNDGRLDKCAPSANTLELCPTSICACGDHACHLQRTSRNSAPPD
jgi:hypothetical protein